MTTVNAAIPIDPDDPSQAGVLAADPLDWAHRATLLVYDRHAAPLAARTARRAERLERNGDRASAETVRRDAVNLLRHACTNYEELVADVAAHYGHGRRDDVISVIRERTLRAIAHRFPALARVCQAVADEREAPPYRRASSSFRLAKRSRGSNADRRPGTIPER